MILVLVLNTVTDITAIAAIAAVDTDIDCVMHDDSGDTVNNQMDLL